MKNTAEVLRKLADLVSVFEEEGMEEAASTLYEIKDAILRASIDELDRAAGRPEYR